MLSREHLLLDLMPQFYQIRGKALLVLEEWEVARESLQSGLLLLRKTGGRWGFSELAELMIELEEKAENDARVAELRSEITLRNTFSTR